VLAYTARPDSRQRSSQESWPNPGRPGDCVEREPAAVEACRENVLAGSRDAHGSDLPNLVCQRVEQCVYDCGLLPWLP
jgi:hypothetical protein